MKGIKHNWSKTDIEYLELYFPHVSSKELGKHFGIGWRTIVRKARELNLQKDENFRCQYNFREFAKLGINHPNAIASRIKPGEHRGRATEFKKGNKPFTTLPLLERLRIMDKKKQKVY